MNKPIINKVLTILLYSVLFCIAGIALFYVLRPRLVLTDNSADVYDLKDMKSLLDDGRQCGYVNLENFIKLCSENSSMVFNAKSDVKIMKDSIVFSSKDPNMFFGIDNGNWWKNKYENMPVSFPDANSFKAALLDQKGIKYIYIPYQILLCVVAYNER